MKKLRIYSDGASYNNGRKDPNKPVYGSFCSLIVNESNEIIWSEVKGFKDVTNNYTEMLGAIVALNKLINIDFKNTNEQIFIEVISDSQYLVKGASEWIRGWIKRNWINSSGNPVENRELWEILLELIYKKHNIRVKFTHIKGHKGKKIKLEEDCDVYFNELCDTYATKMIKEIKIKNNLK